MALLFLLRITPLTVSLRHVGCRRTRPYRTRRPCTGSCTASRSSARAHHVLDVLHRDERVPAAAARGRRRRSDTARESATRARARARARANPRRHPRTHQPARSSTQSSAAPRELSCPSRGNAALDVLGRCERPARAAIRLILDARDRAELAPIEIRRHVAHVVLREVRVLGARRAVLGRDPRDLALHHREVRRRAALERRALHPRHVSAAVGGRLGRARRFRAARVLTLRAERGDGVRALLARLDDSPSIRRASASWPPTTSPRCWPRRRLRPPRAIRVPRDAKQRHRIVRVQLRRARRHPRPASGIGTMAARAAAAAARASTDLVNEDEVLLKDGEAARLLVVGLVRFARPTDFSKRAFTLSASISPWITWSPAPRHRPRAQRLGATGGGRATARAQDRERRAAERHRGSSEARRSPPRPVLARPRRARGAQRRRRAVLRGHGACVRLRRAHNSRLTQLKVSR